MKTQRKREPNHLANNCPIVNTMLLYKITMYHDLLPNINKYVYDS